MTAKNTPFNTVFFAILINHKLSTLTCLVLFSYLLYYWHELISCQSCHIFQIKTVSCGLPTSCGDKMEMCVTMYSM